MVTYILIGLATVIALPLAVWWGFHFASWVTAPRSARRTFGEVGRHLAFLESVGGMRCVEQEYNWRVFGNVHMRYEGPEFCARVVRDRSQWFVSIATTRNPGQERDLCDLLHRAANADEKVLLGRKRFDLETLGQVGHRTFPQVCAMLIGEVGY